jgi:hypothetical protein
MIKQKGNFGKTTSFLKHASNPSLQGMLNMYGQMGVSALSAATPVLTGMVASSWDYTITVEKGRYILTWTNSDVIDHVLIAVLLQYGHGTKNGGYFQGRDYINPAIKPILDKLAEDGWKEVIE